MAITRTQIAKQLLANGGRTGFFTGMREQEQREQEQRAKRGPRDDPDRFGPSNKAPTEPTGKGEDNRSTYLSDQYKKPTNITREQLDDRLDRARDFRETLKFKKALNKKTLFDRIPNFGFNLLGGIFPSNQKYTKEFLENNPQMLALYNSLSEDEKKKVTNSLKGITNKDGKTYEDFLAFDKGAPGLKYAGDVGGLDKYVSKYEINPDGTKGKPLEFGYRQRDDYGEGRNATSDYERRLRELEQSIAANPITSPVEEDEIINYRLMADGGRIGFFTGMREQEQRAKRGPRDDPDRFGPSNKAPTGKGEDGPQKPSTNVGGGGGGITELTSKKNIPTPNIDISKFNIEDLINFGLVDEEQDTMKVAEAINFNKLGIAKDPFTPKSTMTTGSVVDNFMKENPNATKGDFVNALESGSLGVSGRQLFEKNVGDLFEGVNLGKSMSPFDVTPTFQGTTDKTFKGNIDIDKGALEQDALDALPSGFFIGANDGRAVLAEGGMPYEGGIMDLESARQMYSLGKLVKKITRGVKKIAKSPIGKAALAFGAYKLGGGFLKDKGGIPGIFDLIKANPYKSIFGLSALSGLMTKEEDEEPLYAGADIADPNYIMDNPQLFLNRRLSASGGLMRTGYQEGSKEPVAKKVMPLLDMDGQEKDYRETGGFVDMGRMEKADDVPARLSKNEFVFTADAVRNAGEGNVDKGAEVMYNMMKNLESGGEVSEESQGLEGAREMFQTSQRLEEVL